MKPTIAQLEGLLNSENSWTEDATIEILPNGEIRTKGAHTDDELKPFQKPLTFRENLGGEYAVCPGLLQC